ncbi:Os01g0690466 [Oryza sativa Japonica Group]|uniref:Os01g0690466 protein n=1 Tax=Oryza sativa subsp. japonica TaxID=39947 RepID=A0A0P0V6V7_ORYSJ|nr:Os01g0690466 [Oryza sativa Japonica Group]
MNDGRRVMVAVSRPNLGSVGCCCSCSMTSGRSRRRQAMRRARGQMKMVMRKKLRANDAAKAPNNIMVLQHPEAELA